MGATPKSNIGASSPFIDLTTSNNNRRSLQRYIAILCAFAVTMFITSPSLKGIQSSPCSEDSTNNSNNNANNDNNVNILPIAKSNTRGFRPVYVYSKVTPPNAPQYSQSKQDLLILALTKANDESTIGTIQQSDSTNRKPYFVDLAANDAISLSNSLLLEKHGWEGICLEPNPIYWYRLASFRTCTIIGAFLGGTQEEDGKEVDVRLPNTAGRGVYGGIVGDGMDNTGTSSHTVDEKRNIVSIATVFQETNVPSVIDYLSLDVEGAELLVMKDFPFDKHKFKWITIERPKDELVNLLQQNGYKKVMTIAKFGEILFYHTEEVGISEEVIKMIAENLDIKDYTGPWEMPPSQK